MNILDLPDFMVEQVFGWLTYDEIAKNRRISTKMNRICQQLLNRGFTKLIKRHSDVKQKIELLPSPLELSETSDHLNGNYSHILLYADLLIMTLSDTYTPFIDRNLSCFIPGKIIDEHLNLLRLMSTSRPLEFSQELEKLTALQATEHFIQKIAFFLLESHITAYQKDIHVDPETEV